MAALAERRIIPHDELKARSEERSRPSRGASGAPAAARGVAVRGRGAARREDARGTVARGRRSAREPARLAGGIRPARRQPRAHRQQVDLPHRAGSVLAADQGSGGSEEAVARGGRDAGGDCLSPAGDARRGRGNPRRGDVEGHLRRADGDRLDQAARPPQGAWPADHLRHHRGVPVAFRPGGAVRPAGAGGAERAPACSTAACRRALRCRCRPTIRHCATTRTRSSRAISTSAWRRRRSASRNSGILLARQRLAPVSYDAGAAGGGNRSFLFLPLRTPRFSARPRRAASADLVRRIMRWVP